MRRPRRRLNRRSLLVILAGISLVGIMLPRDLTGRLLSVAQILAPFQDWSTRAASAATDAVAVAGESVSRTDHEALQREKQILQHQVNTISAGFDALQRDFQDVSGVRARGLSGGKLLPARTMGDDVLAWRRSKLIGAGSSGGVKLAAAVTTHMFSIDAGQGLNVREGLAVISGEVLLGFVDQVGTHASRIRLLTDRDSHLRVLISRIEGGQYLPLDAEFWMVGTGAEALEVRDIDHRYIKSGAVAVGDTVLSVGDDPRLPVSLTVGSVTRVRPDPDNPLLHILEVNPAVDYGQVRKVFVFDDA